MYAADYLTLLLLNTGAGLWVVGSFFCWGLGRQDYRHWAPPFAVSGLVSLLGGLYMIFVWPMRGPGAFANIAFGELSVAYGATMLGVALAVGRQWRLGPIALFALVVGVMTALIGVFIVHPHLWLTASPIMSGVAFMLSGLVGILALPSVLVPRLWPIRWTASLVAFVAGALWLLMSAMAFFYHLGTAHAGKVTYIF